MTIDAGRAQRILDTQKRTGRKVRVTFNYRYSPPRTQVKDLLMSGTIGDIAFCSWEGYVVQFNGTRGRLEHKCEEAVYINGDGTVPGALKKEGTLIRIYPTREPAYEVPIWTGEGGHGGGDAVMLHDLNKGKW